MSRESSVAGAKKCKRELRRDTTRIKLKNQARHAWDFVAAVSTRNFHNIPARVDANSSYKPERCPTTSRSSMIRSANDRAAAAMGRIHSHASSRHAQYYNLSGRMHSQRHACANRNRAGCPAGSSTSSRTSWRPIVLRVRFTTCVMSIPCGLVRRHARIWHRGALIISPCPHCRTSRYRACFRQPRYWNEDIIEPEVKSLQVETIPVPTTPGLGYA